MVPIEATPKLRRSRRFDLGDVRQTGMIVDGVDHVTGACDIVIGRLRIAEIEKGQVAEFGLPS